MGNSARQGICIIKISRHRSPWSAQHELQHKRCTLRKQTDKFSTHKDRVKNKQQFNINILTKTDYPVDYFLLNPYRKPDEEASNKLTESLWNGFEDVFTWIGCLEAIFTSQIKEVSKTYQPHQHRLCMHSSNLSKKNWKDCRNKSFVTWSGWAF